jgi:SAM-dependent methyltransferase
MTQVGVRGAGAPCRRTTNPAPCPDPVRQLATTVTYGPRPVQCLQTHGVATSLLKATAAWHRTTVADETPWTEVFTSVFETPASNVEARIWADVYGDEYPAELEPYSFTTWSELRLIADALALASADHLIDVGCGRGGPGLWVAATTGASLLGVDISPTALEAGRRRAETVGLGASATYSEGSFDAIPAGIESAQGVLSVDALLFAPDKSAALREIARVLEPGRRLVATTWDYRTQPVNRPPQVDDHRPLLIDAGFRVVSYEETPDWLENHRKLDSLLLDAVDELAEENGESPEEIRAGIQEMAATVDAMSRRVLIVAEKV